MGLNYHICHICGNKMYPQVTDETYIYQGKSVLVSNVRSFKCYCCNEVILESSEVKRIEQIVVGE